MLIDNYIQRGPINDGLLNYKSRRAGGREGGGEEEEKSEGGGGGGRPRKERERQMPYTGGKRFRKQSIEKPAEAGGWNMAGERKDGGDGGKQKTEGERTKREVEEVEGQMEGRLEWERRRKRGRA